MVASGVTYVEFSDDDYAKMKEACKTSVYDVFRNYCGDELVDLAIKTAERSGSEVSIQDNSSRATARLGA